MESTQKIKPNAIYNQFLDFWIIGGTSILMFVVFLLASVFRESSIVIQQKFLMFGSFFALMSILCNHPHFMITFKFGYTRGWRFLLKHWFALLFVPLSMVGVFAIAYFSYDYAINENVVVITLNNFFATTGISFRIGQVRTLGLELISLGVWTMYATVGWHYSKQVYGCMMVYNDLKQYGLEKWQKLAIRYNLISLAFYQFFTMSEKVDSANSALFQDSRFSNVGITSIGFSSVIMSLSRWALIISFFIVIYVFIERYRIAKKSPPITFLIPWIAIYIWWIQVGDMPEFYYGAVPFFHSLQYLLFASKMEIKSLENAKKFNLKISIRIILLLIIGLLFFEFIPAGLDEKLQTNLHQTSWFFMTAFALFINIHHFFIDSTVWKLSDRRVKPLLNQ